MIKELLGKWIGTFAAKSVAVKAASAVAATTLVVTPVAVETVSNYETNQTKQIATEAVVSTASEGGVEGTGNLGDWMNPDGTLNGFVDVSDWTQEDVDAENARREEEKKKLEQELENNSSQKWEDVVKELESADDVKTDDSAKAPDTSVEPDATDDVKEPAAPEQKPEPSVPEVKEPEEEEPTKPEPKPEPTPEPTKPESKPETPKDASNDNNYARPGSVGPNGEVIGNIEYMPGYTGEYSDEKTRQEVEEAKKKLEQEMVDNHPQNWDKVIKELEAQNEKESASSDTDHDVELPDKDGNI